MDKLSKSEREKRILARGESRNHIHCIIGNVIFDSRGRIVVSEDSNAVLKHLLEKDWVEEGKETWTGEHKDIILTPGIYESVLQEVFDPLSKRIERVRE
jgi:hypothetical protein